MWHAASERGAGRGIERGVARGSGAVAQRNRIAERAHQGIRSADGENRQGELHASRAAQTGEGGRNTDRADVCPDPRRPKSVPEESRGRLFSRVTTWAQGLRREPALSGSTMAYYTTVGDFSAYPAYPWLYGLASHVSERFRPRSRPRRPHLF